MCLIAMDNEALRSRISKYSFTTGSIGATGCWCYTQLEKGKVTDQDDINFFNDNQSPYEGKLVSEDKWIFDGWPNLVGYGNVLFDLTRDKDGNYILNNDWDTQSPVCKVTPVEYEAINEYGKFSREFLGNTLHQPYIDNIYKGANFPENAFCYMEVCGT